MKLHYTLPLPGKSKKRLSWSRLWYSRPVGVALLKYGVDAGLVILFAAIVFVSCDHEPVKVSKGKMIIGDADAFGTYDKEGR